MLKYGGVPVVAGQFGAGIVPIGAEKTATGYEIAWKATGANQYWVWNIDSNGNDVPPHPFNGVPANTQGLEALEPSFQQDLNGDGVIGTGPGALASAPLAGSAVGTGDFNGDGQPDILWLGSGNTLTIREMNGSSVIGQAALPAPPSSWRLAGTGDLNGDGKSDILWQNSDGDVGIWEMNGTSILSAVAVGSPGAAWQLQGASDVNGDHKSDLLFFDPVTNQTQTWLMDGTQVASMQAPVSAPATPQSGTPVLSRLESFFPPKWRRARRAAPAWFRRSAAERRRGPVRRFRPRTYARWPATPARSACRPCPMPARRDRFSLARNFENTGGTEQASACCGPPRLHDAEDVVAHHTYVYPTGVWISLAMSFWGSAMMRLRMDAAGPE